MQPWMFEALLLFFAQAGDANPRTLLTQPVRRRILDLIKRRPGIHASALCREAGEAWGTVQYHLALLGQGDLVTTVASGRERRYFAEGIDPDKARIMGVLSQGRRPEIARFIRDNPGSRQVDVCNGVSVSRKTFRASIAPLVDAGLVSERKGLQTNRYFPDQDLEGLLEGGRGPPSDVPESLFDVT